MPKNGLAVLLSDFVRRYIDARSICEGYARTLSKRSAKLIVFAGRDDLRAVLNEATVNAFLSTLDKLKADTRNKYRADFLAIWRAAADEDEVPYPQARRIKRVRVLPAVIECYTESEARALVVAAEHLKGAYPNGIARRVYWPAAIRCAWDSGLRRGDIWRLRRQDIRKDRTLVVVQHKTAKIIVCRFHASTLKALERAGGNLEWPLCEWCFGEHFQEIVEASAVRKGTFRWLRRGSGSRIEASHPGYGHKHLGNGRAVFEKHYDARISIGQVPQVPEL